MMSSCALDEAALRRQAERYRRVGEGASTVRRGERRLIVELAATVDRTLVEELIAVERECCPFFALRWDSATRRLTISVSHGHEEPALDALALALALDE